MAVRLRRAPGPPSAPFELNDASPQAAGLLRWWPTIPSAGTAIVCDLTAQRYNGTVGASASWRNHPAMGWGIDCPGTTNTPVSFGNIPGLAAVGAYTFCAWVQTDTLAGGGASLRYVAAQENGAANGSPLILRLNTTTDKLNFYITDGAYRGPAESGVLAADTLYHVAARYDKTLTTTQQLALFINGVLVGNGTGASNNTSAAVAAPPIVLGSTSAATDRAWDGWIGDTRIYNRALSAAEVWQLYDPATRWELYKPLQRVWQVAFVEAPTEVTAEAAITLGALTLASTAVAPVTAQAGVTLGAVTLAAQAVAPVQAQANVTLGALTVTAAGESTVTAAASITLGGLVVAGVAVVLVQGAASITLGALTLSATAAEAEITFTVAGSIVGVAGAGTIEGPSAAGTLRGW